MRSKKTLKAKNKKGSLSQKQQEYPLDGMKILAHMIAGRILKDNSEGQQNENLPRTK